MQPNPLDGCPVCGKALWDNRETKKNPKAPDYKCKDKNCEGVIWPLKAGETYAPPKNGATGQAQGVDFTKLKQGYSSGGPLPYENQETGAPPSAMPRAVRDEPTKLDGVLSLHDVCVMHSAKRTKELLMQQGLIPTAADILAAAATQMIAAQKVGATP